MTAARTPKRTRRTFTALAGTVAMAAGSLGLWVATYKMHAAQWRFELYYFDFAFGTIAASTLLAVTFGSMGLELTFWDNVTDGGVPLSDSLECQEGKSSTTLKNAHLAPPSPKVLTPYIRGGLLAPPNCDPVILCGSGSDGDWGVGNLVDADHPWIWDLGTSSQYNILRRIPNPGIQPR